MNLQDRDDQKQYKPLTSLDLQKDKNTPPTVSEQEHICTQDDEGLCNCDCHEKPVEPTAPVEGWEIKRFRELVGSDVALGANVEASMLIVIDEAIKNREREIAEGVEKLTRYDGDQYSAGVGEELGGSYLDRDQVLALINKPNT